MLLQKLRYHSQLFQAFIYSRANSYPERADGEDLLEVFQNVAHKLDIKDAVESGVLVPVRCIRVKRI